MKKLLKRIDSDYLWVGAYFALVALVFASLIVFLVIPSIQQSDRNKAVCVSIGAEPVTFRGHVRLCTLPDGTVVNPEVYRGK